MTTIIKIYPIVKDGMHPMGHGICNFINHTGKDAKAEMKIDTDDNGTFDICYACLNQIKNNEFESE